ncbi:MAG TPA: TetR family transcriptional regulator [Actinocrinis sp.]|nr:TetR family transcriptional regulator [Actinocrinis sp.]
MLFDGETALRELLVAGVTEAPEDLEPLPALLWAFRTAVPLLEGNRRLSEPLRRVIIATPALRERSHAKIAVLTEALATALRDRGTPEPAASLAAQIGMATYNHIAARWFQHTDESLDQLLRDTFESLHTLTGPLATAMTTKP